VWACTRCEQCEPRSKYIAAPFRPDVARSAEIRVG